MKRNLLTTEPTKCGLKFINERKRFKECLSLKLNKKGILKKKIRYLVNNSLLLNQRNMV